MKNWLTKKNVLFCGLFVLVVVFVLNNPVMFGFCRNTSVWGDGTKYCYDAIIEIPETLSLLGLFLGVTAIFFSLITYKMRDEVFEHWMKFAKWGVPALMILTYFFLGNHSGGGYLGMGQDFIALLLVLLYGLFCGISIYRIVSKHNQLKRGNT